MFWNLKAHDAHEETDKDAQAPLVLPGGIRRVRIVFKGEVQGVGFRWTSLRCARELDLAGWVKNESDGSVLMELQGTSDQIGRFFTSLNQAYRDFPIRYVIDSKEDVAPDPDDAEFTVRR